MSLSNAINIGRSGLLSAQTGLETVGNNMANQATEGYRRQQVTLSPIGSQDQGTGNFVGRGVQVQQIERQIDEALEARLRDAGAGLAGSQTLAKLLEQVETIHNAYGEHDLGSRLQAMFDAFDELANNPQDSNKRTLAVEQANALSMEVQDQFAALQNVGGQVDGQIDQAVQRVNELLDEIEHLNRQVATSEKGTQGDNGLRDQRDRVLSELAEYMDISTRETSNGMVDVYIGSTPVVLDGKSRGMHLDQNRLRVGSDNTPLEPSTGKLGALLGFRDEHLKPASETLDGFARELAWEVNRLHSQGQSLRGQSQWTSDAGAEDPDASLSSDDANLPFKPQHGSFQIQLTHPGTDQRTTHNIDVNLAGSDPAAHSSLNDIAAQIDAIDGISADVQDTGRLKMTADSSDHQISFGEDSSGFLAATGFNTFFAGSGARDLQVNQRVADDPQRIAAAQSSDSGDNRNAQAIAALRDTPIESLQGKSLSEHWQSHVQNLANDTAQAREQSEANQAVHENLKSHQQARSGVNVDEEAIDLMRFQSSYQANARFLSVVDQMMQTLLGMV